MGRQPRAPLAGGRPSTPASCSVSLSLRHEPLPPPAAAKIDTNSKKEQEEPLWEADWDDQDKSLDFASKLRAELDKSMKE